MAKDFADISRLELAQDRIEAKRDAVSKMVKVWESKNAKRALQGAGLSTMAVTLAACGGSSTTTTTTPTTPVTPPVVTPPAAQAFTLTSGVNNFAGAAGDDTFTAATAAVLQAWDTIDGGTGSDKLVVADAVTGGSFAASTGLAGTITNIEALELSTVGTVGGAAVAATTVGAGTAEVTTITYTATLNAKLKVVIGGQTYESGSALTADATGANAATEAASLINSVLGASVASASTGTVTVTAPFVGADIPVISTSGSTGSVANASTAGVDAIAASAAKQAIQFTVAGTGHATDNTATIYVDGVAAGTFSGVDTTSATGKAAAATAIANAVNGVLGAGTAVATSATVVITSPTAGEALPIIHVATGGTTAITATRTQLTANADAVTEAVAASVFDLSAEAFTNITLDTVGGANIKLADTQDLTLTSTDGAITIDEGKAITVTTTGTTKATTISGDALTSVSVTGGGAAAIDNDKTIDTTLTAGAGTTLTSVTLSKVEGASTVKGKALTNLTIDGPTTAASSVTVTNTATGGHTLNLNLNGAGFEKTYTTAYTVTVTDTTATTMAVTTSGTNNVDLGGASNGNTFTTLTMAGTGKITAEVGSTSLQTINASASSADITLTGVDAATKTISTGSGKDKFTTATTTAVVDSGAGNDTITINAALTAGATVKTGAGDDTVLAGASGSVATTVTATKAKALVDGGDGTDVLDMQLVNNGNAAQFVNFEILGLDGTGTLDSSILSGITGLKMLDAGGATITNLAQTQAFESAYIGTSNSATTTLTMTAAGVTGKTDSYTITLNAQQTSSTATPTSANADAGTIAVAGIEDVTIVSDGTAKIWNKVVLGANTSAQTVTISGDNNLDLSFASNFGEVSASNGTTGVTLIDGSAATGKLNINVGNVVEATANLTVKGGSGADTFTTQAGDTITVEGGAGVDTYIVAASVVGASPSTLADDTVALVTIKGLENGETIDFTTATVTGAAVGAAVDLSAATDLQGALDLLAHNTGLIAHGDFGGKTYIYYDKTGAASGGVGADDVIVVLDGDYDLSLSSFDAGGILTYTAVV